LKRGSKRQINLGERTSVPELVVEALILRHIAVSATQGREWIEGHDKEGKQLMIIKLSRKPKRKNRYRKGH